MHKPMSSPWWRDSNQKASGEAGAIQFESIGYLASVIEHEGVHVSQELTRKAGIGLRGIMNEAEAYRHILEHRVRFDLTPEQVARELRYYRQYYEALPDAMKAEVDSKYGRSLND